MDHTNYVVRRDAVAPYLGIWDTDFGRWYEGAGHDDAFYFAGVPMWRARALAQAVADQLNEKED